ncbi:capsule biosynthesis protein [Methylobacterium organophilum]|uniref:capsule biosynthesis protein n=1 Tax=Methylobacterium organophilum TaxID=410 RepID=UPI001F144753|nr:capsule biosynthesis protein [Methylobacterium organophilum]UMY17845.1 capsule biosynthesis protein [Methylobacterium organophilum]
MSIETPVPQGQPLTTADRSSAVAESLRQIARVTRYVDRKKGIRSYQTHVKRDPWIGILFALLFVLPSATSLVYFGLIASDRYVTEFRFAIRPAIGGADKAAGGDKEDVGTNSGVSQAMLTQDTLIASEYISSRPMIEALEKQMPVREMFSRSDIDWFSRFNPEKPMERFVKYWRWRIKPTIDSSSGIIAVTVEAFTPEESYALAKAILAEAERMTNDLSMRSREDALAESRRELGYAEERMAKARVAMRDLRNREGVLDADKANEANLTVISKLRETKINLVVQLNLIAKDLSPDNRRILDLKAQIRDLDENIDRLEHELASQTPERRKVLANAMTQFEALTNERKDAELYYVKVLAASEKARIIAARNIEFFSPIVVPIMPNSADQPKSLLWISATIGGSALAFALAYALRKFST